MFGPHRHQIFMYTKHITIIFFSFIICLFMMCDLFTISEKEYFIFFSFYSIEKKNREIKS